MRTAALLTALAAATAGVLTVAPSASAGSTACPTGWGSLPESSPTPSIAARLTDIRAGQHPCFDRLVLDVAGKVKAYDVHYGAVARDGSGTAVPLRGTDLSVFVEAAAYDDNGAATYDPARDSEAVAVGGYRTFRQVAWAGSYEGQSTVGVGVRARLPFRVMVVDGPGTGSRLVLDVAHTW